MRGGRLRERDKGHQLCYKRVPEQLKQDFQHQHKKHTVYPHKKQVQADINGQEPVKVVNIDQVDVRCLAGKGRVGKKPEYLY